MHAALRTGSFVALAASLFASALGCTPTLRTGVYDCTDGACPSGMTCWSDHLCRTGIETDGGNGGGNDAGMPRPDGGAGGVCSPECVSPAICAQADVNHGPQWACVGTNAPPSHGQSCVPGPTTGCNFPDGCILGACMRPCEPPQIDPCRFGESCIMVSVMGNTSPVCLSPCPGPCPAGTTCNTTRRLCLPTGW